MEYIEVIVEMEERSWPLTGELQPGILREEMFREFSLPPDQLIL